jgi:hypothetical protein
MPRGCFGMVRAHGPSRGLKEELIMRAAKPIQSSIAAAVLILLPGLSPAASAAEPADKKTITAPIPTQGDAKGAPVVYKPPLRGAPGGRVGGGTRGTGNVFVLSALAPDHMGITASEQPSLYWFISNATSLPVEVAIMDPQGVKPLLEKRLTGPVEKGVHRIDLAELGVRLSPGVAYRWSVTVIPDANRRSRDILAAATIERADVPADVRAKFQQTRKEDMPALYAEAGLWYEALASISELIDRTPDDAALRQQRAELLSQVGLPDIGEGKR